MKSSSTPISLQVCQNPRIIVELFTDSLVYRMGRWGPQCDCAMELRHNRHKCFTKGVRACLISHLACFHGSYDLRYQDCVFSPSISQPSRPAPRSFRTRPSLSWHQITAVSGRQKSFQHPSRHKLEDWRHCISQGLASTTTGIRRICLAS